MVYLKRYSLSQLHFAGEAKLCAAGEALHLPDDGFLLRPIEGFACRHSQSACGCVLRSGNLDDNVLSEEVRREVGLHRHLDFHARGANFVDSR